MLSQWTYDLHIRLLVLYPVQQVVEKRSLFQVHWKHFWNDGSCATKSCMMFWRVVESLWKNTGCWVYWRSCSTR